MKSRHLAACVLCSLCLCLDSGCLSSRVLDDEVGGVAAVALTQTPADVSCLKIRVEGHFTVEREFALTAGQSTVLTLARLPLGNDTFTAFAYAEGCSAITPSALPTWLSDPLVTVLSAGQVAKVRLAMHRNTGAADVSIDFEDLDAGIASDAGDSGLPHDGSVPACTANQKRCVGNNAERCNDRGEWAFDETCDACIDGSCSCDGSPPPRCLHETPQRCSNGHWWDVSPPCTAKTAPFSGFCFSDSFEAVCLCIPASMRCKGAVLGICDGTFDHTNNNGFRDIAKCSAGCVNGSCQPSQPCGQYGVTRCADGSLQQCTTEWLEIGSCDDQPCNGGRRTHNGWLQGCRADGTWLNLIYLSG